MSPLSFGAVVLFVQATSPTSGGMALPIPIQMQGWSIKMVTFRRWAEFM